MPSETPSPSPRSWLTTFYVWGVVLAGLLVAGALAVLAGLWGRLRGDPTGAAAQHMLVRGYRAIARALPYGIRVVESAEVPAGPAVFIANHQSYADVFYLYQLRFDFRFVVKRALFLVPLFGAAMRAARYPRVGKSDLELARQMSEDARALLGHGVSVFVFPEGTRGNGDALLPLQSGAARLALAAAVPVVPVGVAGTADILPRGEVRYARRGAVTLWVGAPVLPESGERIAAFTRRLTLALDAARSRAIAHRIQSTQGAACQEGPISDTATIP